MKALDIYKWIAGSENNYTKPFVNNEALYDRARGWWGTLQNCGFFLILIFIAIGITLAIVYYKPFNNMPGRHYKPRFWLSFLAITAASSLILTLLCLYILAEPKLDGSFSVELRISICNALYASIVYFVTSVLWCNFGTTNAYRFFKI